MMAGCKANLAISPLSSCRKHAYIYIQARARGAREDSSHAYFFAGALARGTPARARARGEQGLRARVLSGCCVCVTPCVTALACVRTCLCARVWVRVDEWLPTDVCGSCVRVRACVCAACRRACSCARVRACLRVCVRVQCVCAAVYTRAAVARLLCRCCIPSVPLLLCWCCCVVGCTHVE